MVNSVSKWCKKIANGVFSPKIGVRQSILHRKNYTKKTLCCLKTQDHFSAQIFGHDVSRGTFVHFWVQGNLPVLKVWLRQIAPDLKVRIQLYAPLSTERVCKNDM